MDVKRRFAFDHCAVVVIDVQNDFCHMEGSSAKRGKDLQYVQQMIPRLTYFLHEARKNQVPVLFVATEHDEATDSEAWLSRYGTNYDRVKTNLSCRKGSWGTGFYMIESEKEEIVVIKHKYSAFVGTDLDNKLQSLGIRSLLFTGVATNICVESTLRDALHHDYFVTLVEDCCAAYDMMDHDSTIRNVRNRFGLVATSQEITVLWNQREGGLCDE